MINDQIFFILTYIDIDFAFRKIATHLTPTKIFTQDGDSFVIKTQSAFKSYDLIFTVGVEKEEFTKGFDNRSIKVNNSLYNCDPLLMS